MPTKSVYTAPPEVETGEIDDRSVPAEEKRQQRRKTHPKGEGVMQQGNPWRMLALSMLKQLVRDAEKRHHKGQRVPDPDRVGTALSLQTICQVAQVSPERVRRRVDRIVKSGDGPLRERLYADPEELEADDYTWLSTQELERRFDITAGCVQAWCAKGQVTALKTTGKAAPWRIRVDDTLQKRLERYWEQSEKDSPVPTVS